MKEEAWETLMRPHCECRTETREYGLVDLACEAHTNWKKYTTSFGPK